MYDTSLESEARHVVETMSRKARPFSEEEKAEALDVNFNFKQEV